MIRQQAMPLEFTDEELVAAIRRCLARGDRLAAQPLWYGLRDRALREQWRPLVVPETAQPSARRGTSQRNKPLMVVGISNGLGAQSMALLVLAARGLLPATLSITADTGWEHDRVLSTGERVSAAEYFERVVEPYARRHGIEAVFVRARDAEGRELPPLGEWTRQMIVERGPTHVKIPLFGSDGGRLSQSCTQRYKVTAIRQELRRRGASEAIMAIGLHYGEIARMKGGARRRDLDALVGHPVWEDPDSRWTMRCYPLIERRMRREDARRLVKQEGLPYLLSSECDGCPHKDWTRWARTDPAVIRDLAEMEALMSGRFFFTPLRAPLPEALERMGAKTPEARGQLPLDLDDAVFGCDGGMCGV